MTELLSRISSLGPQTSGRDPAHSATLADLRSKVDELKHTLATAIETGAKQVERRVDEGAEQLRGEIRRAPGLALTIAVVAGALVAIAITQRHQPQSRVERYAEPYRRAFADLDIADLRARAHRAASSAGERLNGLIPTIDQLAQSLARMEPASIQPMLDTGKTWVRDLWDLISTRVAGSK